MSVLHQAQALIGSDLSNAPTPSAVIDIAVVKENCSRMLDACQKLGVEFRAHVKTHKTVELTRLQVGPIGPVNIVVSTLAEAEYLVPYLLSCQQQGRKVDLLYGFPIPPSTVPRLANLAKQLGPGSVSVLIDHPAQLLALARFRDLTGDITPRIFIKIDVGSRRAGVSATKQEFRSLLDHIEDAENRKTVEFAGLYCHAGHSYNGTGRDAAFAMLCHEINNLLDASECVSRRSAPFKLSVGASPTAMSIEGVPGAEPHTDGGSWWDNSPTAVALQRLKSRARERNAVLEIHAGVYPVLDLQQLSIAAVDASWKSLGFSILAEVASVYPGRGEDGSTEALINAGSLALGREPCRAYQGWGAVMPWNLGPEEMPEDSAAIEDLSGWVVERISQEHGILAWKGRAKDQVNLEVGHKVRIFPSHACIAAAGFDCLLVVDTSKEGSQDTVQDVWVSLRGW